MDFVKRSVTSLKPEIPEGAVKEAKVIFQYQITITIEE